MDTPLFVFSADWHLARSAWVRSGIDGDSYYGLEQLVDLCVKRDVPLVGAGDLLDSCDPSPEDIAFMRRQFDRMKAERLPVFYILGNHDDELWPGSVHDWPIHVDRGAAPWVLSSDRGALYFYGLDALTPGELPAALAAIPPQSRVLICHQSWTELMGAHVTCDGSLSMVPSHIDLVLTGDFHKHYVTQFKRSDDSYGTVLSPGSLCMQTLTEESKKQVFVVGFDEDGDLAYESVPLKTRPFMELRVDDAVAFDALIERGMATIEPLPEWVDSAHEVSIPLVHIRYDPDVAPDASRRLKKALAGYHVMLTAHSKAATQMEYTARKVVAAYEAKGVLGVLQEMTIEGEHAEAVRKDVGLLLAAPDKPAALEALCQAFR